MEAWLISKHIELSIPILVLAFTMILLLIYLFLAMLFPERFL
ncbi:MAG: potassium-transporting ATPase subunit F [Candidatus Melainabacteria bacterium]|nr:potassium-transporting ATPase subunit F [Candidatus Melainabacteria bacterium]